jgi:hypothetical protein
LPDSCGSIDIDVPHDRAGTFEPHIVKKCQRRLTDVDEEILSLYTHGLTTGEISAHFADIYGAEVSKHTISRITDRVVEEMTAWHTRPLEATSLSGLRVTQRRDHRWPVPAGTPRRGRPRRPRWCRSAGSVPSSGAEPKRTHDSRSTLRNTDGAPTCSRKDGSGRSTSRSVINSRLSDGSPARNCMSALAHGDGRCQLAGQSPPGMVAVFNRIADAESDVGGDAEVIGRIPLHSRLTER